MTAMRWTPQALEDLDAIRAYVSRDSVQYAALLVERLFAAVDRLEVFPESGRASSPNSNGATCARSSSDPIASSTASTQTGP